MPADCAQSGACESGMIGIGPVERDGRISATSPQLVGCGRKKARCMSTGYLHVRAMIQSGACGLLQLSSRRLLDFCHGTFHSPGFVTTRTKSVLVATGSTEKEENKIK